MTVLHVALLYLLKGSPLPGNLRIMNILCIVFASYSPSIALKRQFSSIDQMCEQSVIIFQIIPPFNAQPDRCCGLFAAKQNIASTHLARLSAKSTRYLLFY